MFQPLSILLASVVRYIEQTIWEAIQTWMCLMLFLNRKHPEQQPAWLLVDECSSCKRLAKTLPAIEPNNDQQFPLATCNSCRNVSHPYESPVGNQNCISTTSHAHFSDVLEPRVLAQWNCRVFYLAVLAASEKHVVVSQQAAHWPVHLLSIYFPSLIADIGFPLTLVNI